MLRVISPHSVTELPGFSEGLFTVQDLSASQAVRALQPQPGWAILDMCSAPGTKTTQIAELTRDSATILATDIDPKRLERVQENIARLGLKSITIIPYAQLEQGTIGPFDAILLDVPCSNTGVLARRIEARYRLSPETIKDLAAMQRSPSRKGHGARQAGRPNLLQHVQHPENREPGHGPATSSPPTTNSSSRKSTSPCHPHSPSTTMEPTCPDHAKIRTQADQAVDGCIRWFSLEP